MDGRIMKKLFLILCALVLCSSSYAGNIKDIKKVIARKNINGFVGSSSHTSADGPTTDRLYYSVYNASETGTVQYLHAWLSEVDAGTSSVCLTLYSGDGNTKLGTCTIDFDGGEAYRYCDMVTPVSIKAATTYVLGIDETAGEVSFYYSGTGPANMDYSNTYTCGDATIGDDGNIGSSGHSMWADNINQAGP